MKQFLLSPSSLPPPPTQCTYISVPQAGANGGGRTLDCVLSKPAWMWGAEMGVNAAGVAVGNEAVWDRLSDEEFDLTPRLLGMDLLRSVVKPETLWT